MCSNLHIYGDIITMTGPKISTMCPLTKGSYCVLVNQYVAKGFCDVCKGDYEKWGKIIEEQKQKNIDNIIKIRKRSRAKFVPNALESKSHIISAVPKKKRKGCCGSVSRIVEGFGRLTWERISKGKRER